MEDKNTKKRSPLIGMALLLFFIIAPIGSWYYLKQGENFRKTQIDELLPKGEFDIEKIPGITPKQLDSLTGEFLLVNISGKGSEIEEKISNQAISLFDQFGDRPEFNIIRFTLSESESNFSNNGSNQLWKGNLTKPQLLGTGINPPAEILNPDWVIIDVHGRIRGYYTLAEAEKMVVHTAMILPLEKREKIDLKRDKEI